MTVFDAKSKHDCTLVAYGLLGLPAGPMRNYVIAAAYAKGIMRVPWWLRLAHGLLHLRLRWYEGMKDKDKRTFLAWYLVLTKSDATVVKSFLDAIIDHLLRGKDQTDPESYGGFNQSELDILVMHLVGAIQNPIKTEVPAC